MMPSIKPSPNQVSAPQGQPMPQQGEQGGGQPDQGQVVEAIKQVLSRVKQMADQYGIDLQSLMSEMSQGAQPSSKPMPPRPPSGPASMPPPEMPM